MLLSAAFRAAARAEDLPEDDELPKRLRLSLRLEPRLEIADSDPPPEDPTREDEEEDEPMLDPMLDPMELEDEPEEPPWREPCPLLSDDPPIEALDPPPLRLPPPLLPPPRDPPEPPPDRPRSLRLPNICGAMSEADRSAEISPEIRIDLTISPAATVAVRIEAVSTAAEAPPDAARFRYTQAPKPAAAANRTNNSQP
jgi:hypothetical protein